MKYMQTAGWVLLLAMSPLAADTPPLEEGFVSLFDGKTLDGWKVGENASIFQVRDGMIAMECPATIRSPAHLYYAGSVNGHNFKNFDLRVDVMTSVSYTHLRAHETRHDLVCRLLLEKKKKK